MHDLFTITFSFPQTYLNYIFQRYDRNPFRAIQLFLQENEIPELSIQSKMILIDLLPDYFFENEKHKVENLHNVWTINQKIENKIILISVIKTSFREDFYTNV